MKHPKFLPPLPLDEWETSKITLHLILQIIGKVRLKLTPRKNHWWYITLYISPRGITTGSIPFDEGRHTFQITFDVLQREIELLSSKGRRVRIALLEGKTVGEIYGELKAALQELEVEVRILAIPFDMGVDTPFADITAYHHFQWAYIHRFWDIMRWVDGVLKEFSGRFYGKTCPVHLYWHHLDLTVTRFSGAAAPPLDPDARLSDKDAYSHEVISFGFWAGDEDVRQPAFYSYTYPSPEGLEEEKLLPAEARWIESNGSPMAFLDYEDLRKSSDPRSRLLDFLESAYRAGARRAGWDIEAFRTPPLTDL